MRRFKSGEARKAWVAGRGLGKIPEGGRTSVAHVVGITMDSWVIGTAE
jgi:hypothetical protein